MTSDPSDDEEGSSSGTPASGGTGPAPPPFTAGGQVPGEFEGTRIDLGDDLLDRTAMLPMPGAAPPAQPSPPPAATEEAGEAGASAPEVEPEPVEERVPLPSTPEEFEDQLQTARILVGENLVEEAKKVLRRILIADSSHFQARKMLDEVHELELKQIFGEESPQSRYRRTSPREAPAVADAERVMRTLDTDLGLGVFEDAGTSAPAELSLFSDKKALEAFDRKVGGIMAGSTPPDHIDLGIAFFEMGLYDLAATRFRSAARDPDYQASGRSLEAYALIAGGRPFEAVMVLEPLIGDAEVPQDAKLDAFYLMGRAFELLDKPGVALGWYERVRMTNPTYRDLTDRIRTVSPKLPAGRSKGKR